MRSVGCVLAGLLLGTSLGESDVDQPAETSTVRLPKGCLSACSWLSHLTCASLGPWGSLYFRQGLVSARVAACGLYAACHHQFGLSVVWLIVLSC